jgi:hypothetical protein
MQGVWRRLEQPFLEPSSLASRDVEISAEPYGTSQTFADCRDWPQHANQRVAHACRIVGMFDVLAED